MDVLWTVLVAWFGWHVVAPTLTVLALMIGYALLVWVPELRRQKRCTHDKFYEDGRCHAVCAECRKDLGFIGTVREQRIRSNQTGSDGDV